MHLIPTRPTACAAALLLLSAPLAHASIVAYDFTATVTDMTYYAHTSPTGPGPGVVVGSSSYAGSLITKGDQVHGHFFYDTTLGQFLAIPPALPDAQSALYGGPGYANTLAGVNYTVGNNGVKFASVDTPVISVVNNPYVDAVHIVALAANGQTGLQQEVGIDFIDSRHLALNSYALPGEIKPVDYTLMGIYNSFTYASRDDALNVTMAINTLTASTYGPGPGPTPPVPEPETYAMLLAGLGVLALLARRKA
ncbi:PEP-CTERM protein-sorting domain-containing protein/MYXO-CTERM domain-containing protein [Duganella sacchari]|uniref:PEP-CTERM protein-sorting domain-containing protein/MYXO-CTERM domain-containing protein n=1 Tax=Duganella sacchari TaxID=551987 RepID=A0A1M7HFZ1_9BURK|nr:PEP-CTERM sorting domain-containing protein [Duganella sacchari]SHM27406.1 PEP-CTERM protein-sorting domain-containing protein/MYXO-CTERM domain-containing protein [Duganella sacchari]